MALTIAIIVFSGDVWHFATFHLKCSQFAGILFIGHFAKRGL